MTVAVDCTSIPGWKSLMMGSRVAVVACRAVFIKNIYILRARAGRAVYASRVARAPRDNDRPRLRRLHIGHKHNSLSHSCSTKQVQINFRAVRELSGDRDFSRCPANANACVVSGVNIFLGCVRFCACSDRRVGQARRRVSLLR